NEGLAAEALRTLGVAYRRLPAAEFDKDDLDDGVEHELVFAGLIGMIDPPRPEAVEAVTRARKAGIRLLMLTGDHPVTAGVIAAELGVTRDGKAVTGSQLKKMSDEDLAKTLRE